MYFKILSKTDQLIYDIKYNLHGNRSLNFSILTQKQTTKTTTWRCSVRRKDLKCYASVNEVKGVFTEGKSKHVHPADPIATKM